MWQSDPHILSCYRNVIPDPYSILVPECGTPIHILSWYRNVAPDPYTILVSEPDIPFLIILSWCWNVALQSIYYPGTGTWHPIHILSWCQNVKLRSSYTILVPERGTRSIFYPGTGTWHPIHILSWCRNVTPNPYSILVRNVAPDPLISPLSFIKPSFIPRHHH